MKHFAALYDAIDASTATSSKVAALVAYFAHATPADAAWTVAFLLGRRPKRLVKSADLRAWAAEAAQVPDWLFEDSYAQAGDLAETISLLVPEQTTQQTLQETTHDVAWWIEERLLPLSRMEPALQRQLLHDSWHTLGGTQRFVFNKLLTGAFRVGVSDGLVVRVRFKPGEQTAEGEELVVFEAGAS